MRTVQNIRRAPKTRFGALQGFTLIELLVAMAVLGILIVMVGNIFLQASTSWNIGTQTSEANTAARAALNLMAQELSQAVAGPIDVAPDTSGQDVNFSVPNENEIRFTTLTGDTSTNNRALRGGIFYWEQSGDHRNTLRYCRLTSTDMYNTSVDIWNHSGVQNIISNVVDFRVYAYLTYDDFLDDQLVDEVPATNQLPFCVDLYLELMTPDDMLRYQELSYSAQYRNRHAHVYSTRVYFFNRTGFTEPDF